MLGVHESFVAKRTMIIEVKATADTAGNRYVVLPGTFEE